MEEEGLLAASVEDTSFPPRLKREAGAVVEEASFDVVEAILEEATGGARPKLPPTPKLPPPNRLELVDEEVPKVKAGAGAEAGADVAAMVGAEAGGSC